MHHFQWYDGQPYTVSCIFLAVSFIFKLSNDKVSIFVKSLILLSYS